MPEVGIHGKGEVELPALLEEFKRKLGDETGAIGCFIGRVRGRSKGGEPVKALHYESSDEAARGLGEIAAKAEERDGISRVAIHHVVDDVGPGEDVLYVIVAGEHCAEIFEALPWIMDRIKGEAQIWKKEITETKEYWAHEAE